MQLLHQVGDEALDAIPPAKVGSRLASAARRCRPVAAKTMAIRQKMKAMFEISGKRAKPSEVIRHRHIDAFLTGLIKAVMSPTANPTLFCDGY
nr:hypothetical protein [uncultured Noviherbaspirillum sp.]